MERDCNVDFLKGFAILLMVMGHYLASSISGIEDCGANSWALGEFIYSFHMPLFFVLSGLICGKKIRFSGSDDTLASLIKNVLHKAQGLLLPGFTFMVINLLLVGGGKLEMAWFLKVLFQIWLVFQVVHFISVKWGFSLKYEIVLHTVVFVAWFCVSHLTKGICVFEHLWFHGAAARYPYFVIGYVISRVNLEERFRVGEGYLLFTVALVIFIGSFFCISQYLSGKIASYVSGYITAPAATLCCLYVGHRVWAQFGERKWYRVVCYMGQKTLSIYLIHAYFIIATPDLAKIWANMSFGPSVCLQLFASLLFSTLSISICLVIEYIISQSRILSFIFFGRRRIKSYISCPS